VKIAADCACRSPATQGLFTPDGEKDSIDQIATVPVSPKIGVS
jgi:hypothetical protein